MTTRWPVIRFGVPTLRHAGQRPWVRAALAALALLGPGSLTTAANDPRDLPSLGDGASSIVSPQMEAQIGTVFLKQLNAALPMADDVLIQYYVEQHINFLAQHSQMQQPLQAVAVVDNPNINAFAAPGGIIGINLGLLIYAQDVAEYSSVIAHEMAHLSQRHFARGLQAQQASSIPNMIGLLAAVLVGAAGGTEAGLAALTTAQAIGQSNQLRFSREREQEAEEEVTHTGRHPRQLRTPSGSRPSPAAHPRQRTGNSTRSPHLPRTPAPPDN